MCQSYSQDVKYAQHDFSGFSAFVSLCILMHISHRILLQVTVLNIFADQTMSLLKDQ